MTDEGNAMEFTSEQAVAPLEPIPFAWTPELIQRLGEYLDQGLSRRQIANIFGCSRNAVAGAAHRNFAGVKTQVSPKWTDEEKDKLRRLIDAKLTMTQIVMEMGKRRGAISRQIARQNLPKPKRVDFVFKGERAAPKKAGELIAYRVAQLKKTALPKDEITPADAVGLLELTDQMCRWPYGTENFKFCGKSGADMWNGRPYCPQHTAASKLQFLCAAE